jgi:hypothetical protein
MGNIKNKCFKYTKISILVLLQIRNIDNGILYAEPFIINLN